MKSLLMQTENISVLSRKAKEIYKVRAYTGSGDEKKVGDWSNELVVEADDSWQSCTREDR